MKLFVKFLFFLVVLALAGPFIMRGPDGKPLMSLKDLSLPEVSMPVPQTPPEKLTGKEEDAWIAWSKDKPEPKGPKVYIIDPQAKEPPKARAGVYYRWKDSNGIWQFSNLPNPDTPNIVIETNPNENVLQSLSSDKIDTALGRVKEIEPMAVADADEEEDSGLDIPLPTTIPITEVPELINQAKAVQEIMNKRTEMLNNNNF